MSKLTSNKFNAVIIVALLSLLVISQAPTAFSQQQTNAPPRPMTISPPGPLTYQVYWNGSAWASLPAGQQPTTSYEGLTNVTLPNLPAPKWPVTYPNPTELDNALSFISSVLDIDLTHYSVELGRMGPLPPGSVNSSFDQNVKTEDFILHSNNAVNLTDGMIDTMCMVNGDRIFYICVSQFSGETPFLNHPLASSVQDQIGGFLDRYANYSGDPTVGELHSLVETYGITGPSVETLGDSTMQVTNEYGPYITFVRAPQGINNTYDNIILWYQNGMIKQFIDLWNRIPVGSFNVIVNQSEAEQIAENAAKNYSFSYGGVTLSNFTLSNADNAVLTDLEMQPRDGLLYPVYGVSLGLSRMFAGGITELQVGVWADTGQVAGINYVSSYGGLSSTTTTAPFEPTSTPQTLKAQNAAQSTNAYIIVATVSTALAIAVSIVLKKKR